MSHRARFLMCPPDVFSVDYVINPWMEGNIHKSSHETAVKQWQALRDLLVQDAEVELITPQSGLPDMVFTANAGMVVGNKFVLSRFCTVNGGGKNRYFRNGLRSTILRCSSCRRTCHLKARATP